MQHPVQAYGKISLSEKGKKDWRTPDGFAVYYAAMPDALLISFNENVVQRALTRSQARATAKLQEKKQPPATRPYLGESFAVQVDGGASVLPLYPAYVALVLDCTA